MLSNIAICRHRTLGTIYLPLHQVAAGSTPDIRYAAGARLCLIGNIAVAWD